MTCFTAGFNFPAQLRDSSHSLHTSPLSNSPPSDASWSALLKAAIARHTLSRVTVSGKESPMKQLRVLCLSLALMFSLSGCCCGLFGHGGGGYGAGYPGGCSSCGGAGGGFYGGAPVGGGAFYGPGAATGGCGPGGCGTTAFPSGASLSGGPSAAATGLQPGPVAFAPMQAIQTY